MRLCRCTGLGPADQKILGNMGPVTPLLMNQQVFLSVHVSFNVILSLILIHHFGSLPALSSHLLSAQAPWCICLSLDTPHPSYD